MVDFLGARDYSNSTFYFMAEGEGHFPMIFLVAGFKWGWVIFWVQEIIQSLFHEKTLALQKWNRTELTTPILGMLRFSPSKQVNGSTPTRKRYDSSLSYPTTIGKILHLLIQQPLERNFTQTNRMRNNNNTRYVSHIFSKTVEIILFNHCL